MSGTDRLSLRPFDATADHEPIAELINATDAHDGLDRVVTVPVLRLEMVPGGRYDPVRDSRVAELDGAIAGFLRVSSRERGPAKVVHRSEVWTRPDARRRGVGRALVAWSEERSRALRAAGTIGAPEAVHEMALPVHEKNEGSVAFAEAVGYRHVRYFFEMRRRLDRPIPDLPLPAGLEIRPVEPAQHRAIWEANEEAFQDHWEPVAPSESDFEIQFADPDVDTSLWRIAWDGDQVAGVCFNTIYAEENERLGLRLGWLDDVSVRRPWRRRGLAAALIALSLRALRDRGMDYAGLGVDAENPSGALALYRGLGFERHNAFRLFRKPL